MPCPLPGAATILADAAAQWSDARFASFPGKFDRGGNPSITRALPSSRQTSLAVSRSLR